MTLIEGIVTLITGLLGSGGILFYLVKNYVDKRAVKTVDTIKEHVSKEVNSTAFAYDIVSMDNKKQQIERFLDALCMRFNAQSAWIGLFHNGELGSNGDHLIKVTAVYEWPEHGLKNSTQNHLSVKDIVKHVNVLQMGNWIGKLLKDEWYCNSSTGIDDALVITSIQAL